MEGGSGEKGMEGSISTPVIFAPGAHAPLTPPLVRDCFPFYSTPEDTHVSWIPQPQTVSRPYG